MAEPDEIAARVEQLLAPGPLAGKRVLVTAGGTREPLDAVRFLGNRSSGRMGVALAEEARRRGAEVVAARREPRRCPRRTASRRSRRRPPSRCSTRRSRSPTSTSRCSPPPSPTTGPRSALAAKRTKSGEPWTLELEPTADIARALGEREATGPGARRLRRRARRGGPRAQAARCSRRRTPTSSSSTTSRAPTSGSTRADNEVVLVSRARRAHGAEGAEGRDRRRDPRRGRAAARDRLSDAYDLFQEGRQPPEEGHARRRRRCRSRRRSGSSPTRPRSARRSGSPTSASAAGTRPRPSSAPCSSSRPTDDYAHYALGRALEKQGRDAEANGHYKLASSMSPASEQLRRAHPRARLNAMRAVVQRVSRASVDARRRDRRRPLRPARRRGERRRRRRRAARRQGRPAADLRGRRRQVRPLAARHRRRGARRLAVHADRRHGEGNRPTSPTPRGPTSPSRSTSASCAALRELGVPVETGVFGARMRLELVNDGPVTIVLDGLLETLSRCVCSTARSEEPRRETPPSSALPHHAPRRVVSCSASTGRSMR